MNSDELTTWLQRENMLYWLRTGGATMGKNCERERMYVDRDFDCEGCTLCRPNGDG